MITKPDFPDSLGKDAQGRYMFSLGRVSFNMFGARCRVASPSPPPPVALNLVARVRVRVDPNRDPNFDTLTRTLTPAFSLISSPEHAGGDRINLQPDRGRV